MALKGTPDEAKHLGEVVGNSACVQPVGGIGA